MKRAVLAAPLAIGVAILGAAPMVAGRAAEYVPPPIMPLPTAWQGRAGTMVRILDKIDAHVETLTLKAGETGTYKGLAVTARSCMDRPDGLPADAGAFLDIRDRRGDVPSFSGWTFSREPAIGVFESPIYGVQLQSCDGELVAPMAPPLPSPVPPPAALDPDQTAGAPGSSVSIDAPAQEQPGDAPDAVDGPPPPRPGVPPTVVTPSDAPPSGDGSPDGDAAQPNPVYPDGPPPAQPPPR